MYQAYMIRNDGEAIPVRIHVYGNPDEVEETIYASQWLYQHTNFEKTRNLILDLIKTFVYDRLSIEAGIVDSLIEWQNTLPYKVVEADFIQSVSDKLEDATIGDLENLNHIVSDELNQEFMRVRYGGMFNSSAKSKELVFRISSTAFNWFNIIYMFVADHKNEIEYVTIVKDEESTGYKNYFYKYKGEVYDRMPIDQFLTQSGNPVVEEYSYEQRDSLKDGKSIVESFGNINFGRMHEALKLMHYHEVKDRGIWQKVNP